MKPARTNNSFNWNSVGDETNIAGRNFEAGPIVSREVLDKKRPVPHGDWSHGVNRILRMVMHRV
jgi:hypothetical protein